MLSKMSSVEGHATHAQKKRLSEVNEERAEK